MAFNPPKKRFCLQRRKGGGEGRSGHVGPLHHVEPLAICYRIGAHRMTNELSSSEAGVVTGRELLANQRNVYDFLFSHL